MLPWTQRPQVLSLRHRSRVADLAVEVLEAIQRHRTGRAVALFAHYGFLSIFPLLLVLTTILGFVLEGNEDLQDRIVDSVLAQIPILGQQLSADPDSLQGSGIALAIGVLIALWSGLRAFVIIQIAMDDAWDVPVDARSNFALQRARALVSAVVIVVGSIAGAVGTGLAAVIDKERLATLGLVAAAAVVNLVVLAVGFRVLTTPALGWRHQILPGAAVAAVAFTVFQLIGTTVVARAISRASDVYGTFATVIGLFLWLTLHGWAAFGGAELNAALDRTRSRRASVSS